MATYEYDEAGVMAAYFLITFLALILVPVTISTATRKQKNVLSGCECNECVDQHRRISERARTLSFLPNFSRRTYFLVGGWSLFAFISYKVSNTKLDSKIYDPFEILGISSDTTNKDIKSHFKKLSRLYHPDKVQATANQTIEAIQDHFVRLTKAYKSLTDETIRENWIKYNNPDGPQRMSMGIALPKWVIEGKNNIWVLGFYGILFGGALPAFVGRWWFGSRKKTKDGINSRVATSFFKLVKEESTMEDIIGILVKSYELESSLKVESSAGLDNLEKAVEKLGASKWDRVKKLARDDGESVLDHGRRKALILIYAHLLRISITDSALQKEQAKILLQTPLLLNGLLAASLSRNWLISTMSIMRLQARLAQALPLDASHRLRVLQLPGVKKDDVEKLSPQITDITDFIGQLGHKSDTRVVEMEKTVQKWCRIEIVDAAFRVIGERVVSPSAITYLVVKLRLSPPGVKSPRELSVDETKRSIKMNDTKDDLFLNNRAEFEEVSPPVPSYFAHAPHWPAQRKPSWWIVLADEKSNRVVVPPFKITDVPYSQPDADRNYRSYKIQFQSPPNTGMFTWKVYVVSDTFVGEDASMDITLKIEDPPALDDQPFDDDISDPDEDTLAGQMAAMRGGPIKKPKQAAEESDEESSTDDDNNAKADSSDSDSD